MLAFQRKCFDRIDEFKRNDKTIVFVSHDTNSINKLCKMSVFLEHGEVRFMGETEKVVYDYNEYMNNKEIKEFKKSGNKDFDEIKDRWGTREIEITDVKMHDKNNNENSFFNTGDPMKILMYYKINNNYEKPTFGVAIFSNDGTYISGIHTKHDEIELELNKNNGIITLKFDKIPLLAGLYKITAGVCSDNRWDKPYDVKSQYYSFKVQSIRKYDGLVQFEHTWETC